MSNSYSSIKVGLVPTEPFATMQDFRQGSPLQCDLFNFVMESVLQKAGCIAKPLFFEKDIDIMRRTKRDLTAAFYAIVEVAVV